MSPLHRPLSRRALLRGLGTAIALPVLEAMVPAGCSSVPSGESADAGRATRTGAPVRLVFVTVPNGFYTSAWSPTTDGTGFALPSILAPLAPVRGNVAVYSGYANDLGITPGAFHSPATATMLTCTAVDPFRTAGGPSVDQLAAAVLGGDTTLPSLQLGTAPAHEVAIDCDGVWGCMWGDNVAWQGAGRPMPKDADPRSVFARLFGTGDGSAWTAQSGTETSVLDYAADDANRLARRLGTSDRARLDQYLTSIRELEHVLAALPPTPPAGTVVPASGLDLEGRFDAMVDLTVLALQADVTRIVTLQHGYASYDYDYAFLGVDPMLGGHHSISHHNEEPARVAAQKTIGTWEVARFARLVAKLAAVDDGGASLLDQSLALFTSDLLDGFAHTSSNLPVLLAGRGGNRFDTGFHRTLEGNPSIGELYRSMLAAAGAVVDHFP